MKADPLVVSIFLLFIGLVLGISFYLGRKARDARGYYAAHGEIHWLVNGIAFAGDYLSAASFLGICGMIAFYGYDGFLYSIGFLAGWVVALFVIAEPLKRLGRFTFADALDNRFNSRGIKLSAAISTLLVSLFYLIPQMVGAGALARPLLPFLNPVAGHAAGVLIVGVVVTVIVVTAGMVSTTWVQFIKGSMLVFFCAILVVLILNKGLTATPALPTATLPPGIPVGAELITAVPGATKPATAPPKYFALTQPDGAVEIWRETKSGSLEALRSVTVASDETKHYAGFPSGTEGSAFKPASHISKLPNGESQSGPLGPVAFLVAVQNSTIQSWTAEKFKTKAGAVTAYIPKQTLGADLLVPGGSPTFKGIRSTKFTDKLDFISLMLALFAGTASLPHILIRYYTVKDQAAARKSTVAGIAAIAFFYVLTLYLGLGAMTSGALDTTVAGNSNLAATKLAETFGKFLFAVISAIAFTTVLGTVSGLIMAASGAVAHDLMTNFLKIQMTDHQKVNAGKIVAVVVGAIAMALGIVFREFNAGFLVGWAFNVAASANLPALIMLLFWKKTTKQGITAAIVIGLVSSLAWLLMSGPAYQYVYNLKAADAIVPFSQPGIVTIPLGFIVLVVVSLMTQPGEQRGSGRFEVISAPKAV